MPSDQLRADLKPLTPAQQRRSLVAVIASIGTAGLTLGLTFPLLALILARDGFDPTWIGVNAAATSLAIFTIGPLVPRVIDALGVLRAMYLSIAGAAVIMLLLPLWPGFVPWLLLRFVLGGFDAISWIVSETWVISATNKANRGRILALYVMVFSAGFAGGPLLITLVGIEGWAPFLVCAGLIALSGVPLLFAHGCEPQLPPRPPAAVSAAFRFAPTLLAAATLAGFTGSALFTLLPVYGLEIGMAQDRAVLMLTVMLVGNLALQLPIGWLADRYDRSRLLIVCGAIFLLSPLALPLVIGTGVPLWGLLVLWGGASLGIYTLALTILGDRFQPAALAGANAAVVASYEFGSIFGPILGGGGMDTMGPGGLMVVLAIAAVLFLGFALLRGFRGGMTKERGG